MAASSFSLRTPRERSCAAGSQRVPSGFPAGSSGTRAPHAPLRPGGRRLPQAQPRGTPPAPAPLTWPPPLPSAGGSGPLSAGSRSGRPAVPPPRRPRSAGSPRRMAAAPGHGPEPPAPAPRPTPASPPRAGGAEAPGSPAPVKGPGSAGGGRRSGARRPPRPVRGARRHLSGAGAASQQHSPPPEARNQTQRTISYQTQDTIS